MTENAKVGPSGLVSNRAGSLVVSVRSAEGWIEVAVSGELDLSTVSTLEDSLHPFSGRDTMILFDLAGISFVDVVGIKPVIRRCDRGEARVGATSASVRRMLDLVAGEIRVDPWAARLPLRTQGPRRSDCVGAP